MWMHIIKNWDIPSLDRFLKYCQGNKPLSERRVDMKTMIGKGRTSEVYKDEDRAFKVYPSDHPMEYIKEELRVNQMIAQHTQLPMDPLVATDEPFVLKMKYLGTETMTSKMLNREKMLLKIWSIYSYPYFNIRIYRYITFMSVIITGFHHHN
jgi:hypothetical protein